MKVLRGILILCLVSIAAPADAEVASSIRSEYLALQEAIKGSMGSLPAGRLREVRARFFVGTEHTPPRLQATPAWLRQYWLSEIDRALARPRVYTGRLIEGNLETRRMQLLRQGPFAPGVDSGRLTRMFRIGRDYHHMNLVGDAAVRELDRARQARAAALIRGFGFEQPAGVRPSQALIQALDRLEARGVSEARIADPSSIRALRTDAGQFRVPVEVRQEMRATSRWLSIYHRDRIPIQVSSLISTERGFDRRIREAGVVAGQLARGPGAPVSRLAGALGKVRGGPLALGAAAIAVTAGMAMGTGDRPRPSPDATPAPGPASSPVHGVQEVVAPLDARALPATPTAGTDPLDAFDSQGILADRTGLP